ncbi:hypothetical protein ACHAPT_013316 [Fusarium lateritium]
MAAEQEKTAAASPAETPAAPAKAEVPAEGHAGAPAKAAVDEKPAQGPAPSTPLIQLNHRLKSIFRDTHYKEMWGVELSDINHVPTRVVLQKFLRANNDDVPDAERQLCMALEWRKKMKPTALVTQTFNKKKFNDLGFVTVHKDETGKETIITWNIYGAVKNNKATFGDVQEFIKWRVAIMELSIQKLKLDQVTEPIPEGGEDPYQMVQVHDYQNVSFFRMDPAVKAASKETIAVFSMAYPELLAHKYFVNVPAIMGWMFGAMKLFLAAATLRKFHPMASGTTLATELKDIVSTLPKEYGGQGPSVKEGQTISLAEEGEAPAKAPVAGAASALAPVDKETDEKATEIDDEKPVEKSLEKLTLQPVEEVPENDKETAVHAAETNKENAVPVENDKETAVPTETEKQEVAAISEAEERKETAA